jgi:hypothetical protein
MSTSSATSKQAIENAVDVIERFGGIRPMAKKMNVAVTTVQGWKKRDRIPANRYSCVLEAAEENQIDLSDLIAGAEAIDMAAQSNENEPAAPVEPAPVYPKAINKPAPSAGTHPMPEGTALRAQRVRGANDLDSKLSTQDKGAISSTAWIFGGLIGLAILAGFGFMFFQQNESKRLAHLHQDMTEIRQDAVPTEEKQSFLSNMVPKNLDERINRLQEQASAAKKKMNDVIATADSISHEVMADDGKTVSERAQLLNERVQEETGLNLAAYFGLEDLMQNINTLEQTAQGQTQLNKTMAELAAVFGSINEGASHATVNEQLEMAKANMPAINETFANVPAQDLKAAGLLLAMSQFRKSLNRDNTAFNDDLAVLKMLVGEKDSELSAAIDRLAPYSAQGILTPDGLTNEFKSIAGEAVIASIKGEDVSLQDKISGRIGEVMTVEKDGEMLTGNATQKAVVKAENALQQGDIAAAIALVEQLDGPAAKALSPWIKQAQATLSAQKIDNVLQSAMSGKGAGLSALGLGNLMPGGTMVRDKYGAVNVYTPNRSGGGAGGKIQKAVKDMINKSGL